ncbi:MAG: helix-turn-helix domain-containing protein [bacterium]
MSVNLWGVKEAAVRLGIAEGTLRHWLSQKRVPYVKLGRRTLLDPRELERLIEAKTVREEDASLSRRRSR